MWVWLELYSPPSSSEADLLQEVVRAWFLVGRLGGFNSQNMQASSSVASATPSSRRLSCAAIA